VLQFCPLAYGIVKSTAMNPAEKKNTLTFDEALREMGVKKSWDTLVGKIDPEHLRSWLRDISGSSDRYRKRNEDKRRASQLAREARDLASEIERATKSPPIAFFGTGSDIQTMLSLPGSLRAYASYWEKLLSIRWPGGMTSPRADSVAALLEIIKKRTGSYRYRQVADVLNAMDVASRGVNGGASWDVASLKQAQYRSRKRLKKILKS
jgi:hypothetical protein